MAETVLNLRALLNEHILNHAISNAVIAEAIGMSESNVSKFLRGDGNISIGKLELMMHHLGAKLDFPAWGREEERLKAMKELSRNRRRRRRERRKPTLPGATDQLGHA